MALPNITPVNTNVRPLELPGQPAQPGGFSDMLRALATLQTLQYRAQRNARANAAQSLTGMPPASAKGDWMLMPNGEWKFVVGQTAEMRQQNLAMQQQIELDNLVKADQPLQDKLLELERSANTMSYGKQNELLEGARSDVRRIAEANGVKPDALLRRVLAPHTQRLETLAKNIAQDDGLAAIMDSAKIAGSRVWNTIKQVGAMGDSAAKLRLGEEQNTYAQKVTDENAYLRDQQLRAQEGQNVFERMTGPQGNILANIASGAIDTGIQFAPAAAATVATGGAAIPAWVAAGLWGAGQGVQGQAERIAGSNLNEADKLQAMDAAAEQAAAIGAIANAPFALGKAASTVGHLLRPAGVVNQTRTLRNYITKDLPITAVENLIGDVGDTVGQNIVFDRATGVSTPATEGIGEAVVGSLGASIPLALIPWRTRPRPASSTPAAPAQPTATEQPAAPNREDLGSQFKATMGKASKQKTLSKALDPEFIVEVRSDPAWIAMWNDLKSASKGSYDDVEDALVKYILAKNGSVDAYGWDVLENMREGSFLKKSQRPETSILGADDTINKNGKEFLRQFLAKTNTEYGWEDAKERYRARGGVVPESAPVGEYGNEGTAGTGSTNTPSDSGVAGTQPASIEGTPNVTAPEPSSGDRATEGGGDGGTALQSQRPIETLEVPPAGTGSSPDAGTDAGRYPDGAGARGSEPDTSAGTTAGEGVRSDGNAEPAANAGSVNEPDVVSVEQVKQDIAAGTPLNAKHTDVVAITQDNTRSVIEEALDDIPDLVSHTTVSRADLEDYDSIAGALGEITYRYRAEAEALQRLAKGEPSGIAPSLEAEGVEAGNRARIELHNRGKMFGTEPRLVISEMNRDAIIARSEYRKAKAAYDSAQQNNTTPVPQLPNRFKTEDFAPIVPEPTIRNETDLYVQLVERMQQLGDTPYNKKFLDSLVTNPQKRMNFMRSLVYSKLKSAGFPGMKNVAHLTRARNELEKLGVTAAAIPSIPDFQTQYELYRKLGMADDPVDLYLSLIDEEGAKERTINADGCKTI